MGREGRNVWGSESGAGGGERGARKNVTHAHTRTQAPATHALSHASRAQTHAQGRKTLITTTRARHGSSPAARGCRGVGGERASVCSTRSARSRIDTASSGSTSRGGVCLGCPVGGWGGCPHAVSVWLSMAPAPGSRPGCPTRIREGTVSYVGEPHVPAESTSRRAQSHRVSAVPCVFSVPHG